MVSERNPFRVFASHFNIKLLHNKSEEFWKLSEDYYCTCFYCIWFSSVLHFSTYVGHSKWFPPLTVASRCSPAVSRQVMTKPCRAYLPKSDRICRQQGGLSLKLSLYCCYSYQKDPRKKCPRKTNSCVLQLLLLLHGNYGSEICSFQTWKNNNTLLLNIHGMVTKWAVTLREGSSL